MGKGEERGRGGEMGGEERWEGRGGKGEGRGGEGREGGREKERWAGKLE